MRSVCVRMREQSHDRCLSDERVECCVAALFLPEFGLTLAVPLRGYSAAFSCHFFNVQCSCFIFPLQICFTLLIPSTSLCVHTCTCTYGLSHGASDGRGRECGSVSQVQSLFWHWMAAERGAGLCRAERGKSWLAAKSGSEERSASAASAYITSLRVVVWWFFMKQQIIRKGVDTWNLESIKSS